jgi:hypothetical protein
MLPDGESHPTAMDGVATDYIKDLCIFFACRAERSPTGWDVVKEIFYLDGGLSCRTG